jgi:predicted alpha/beta-fold hydrolase
MKTMKTAMQEYSEQLMNILGDDIVNNFTIEQTNAVHYLNKEMLEKEKQQIIDARVTSPILPFRDDLDYRKEAEDYYNEKFELK